MPDVKAAGAFPSKRHLLCSAAPTKYQNLLHPSPDSVGLDVGELTPQHKKGGREAKRRSSEQPQKQNSSLPKWEQIRWMKGIKHLNSATYVHVGAGKLGSILYWAQNVKLILGPNHIQQMFVPPRLFLVKNRR